MLMVPLIGLILISMQTAIIFFLDQTLQTATKQASRQLMTGTDQSATVTQAQFKSNVCALATVFNCNGIMVDVQSSSNFAAISTANLTVTYGGTGAVSNTWSYNPGGPGDIVIMRVMYDWPVFGGPFAAPLSTQPDGGHLLVATVVFKNEPYGS